MFRSALSLTVIYAIFLATLAIPAGAQQPTPTPSQPDPASERPQNEKDIKQAVTERSSNGEMPEFDPVQAEKEQNRIQTQKKGWTTKNKLLLAGFIVGMAALVFLLIKYGKNCLRTSPPGCGLGTDDFCYCEEYERRNP